MFHLQDQASETVDPFGNNGSVGGLSWIEALTMGACTSSGLQTIQTTQRVPIVGDWMKEGDLGFIFATRGVGKTWLALDLAIGIAAGRDVGPWKVHATQSVLYLDGEMPSGDIKERDRGLNGVVPTLTYISHERLFDLTGRVMNLADPELQEAILEMCKRDGFKVLFLDNLSALVSEVRENEGGDWELLQQWLLHLRRHKITVVFVHHAGRNNQMRGHSKREDVAFWILRLDRPSSVTPTMGTCFVSRFTKWRNARQEPVVYKWKYVPHGDRIQVSYEKADNMDVLRQHLEDGLESATEIAEEMGVTKGYVSKLAKRAANEGWLSISKGKYKLKDSY